MCLSNDEEMEVFQLINIVFSCLQQNPDRRPSMNDVQTALQGKMKLELTSNEMVVKCHGYKNDANKGSISGDSTLFSNEMVIKCHGYKNDATRGSISGDSTLFSNESEIVSQHSSEKF